MGFCENCYCSSCNEHRARKEEDYKKHNPPPVPPPGFRLVVVIYPDHNSGLRSTRYHAVKSDIEFDIQYSLSSSGSMLHGDQGDTKPAAPGSDIIVHYRNEWFDVAKLPQGSLKWSGGSATRTGEWLEGGESI